VPAVFSNAPTANQCVGVACSGRGANKSGVDTHTISFNRAGNLLLISQLGSGPEVWTFDMKKLQYQAHKYPATSEYSEDSIAVCRPA
jgi:hypothetical protein